jgi:hypothetical protein
MTARPGCALGVFSGRAIFLLSSFLDLHTETPTMMFRTLLASLLLLGAFSCAEGDTNFTNVVASGDITAGDDLTVTDAISAADVAASDDMTVGDDLTVTGDAAVTGTLTVTAGAELVIPVAALQVIRFCGNGMNGATATYMGPVLLDDTEADLAFGGAGCDGLDNTTEGTADAPWHSSFAFKPVAMVCVGRCTGASAANDAVTYQLRDDTADVTGMACTASAWSGDDAVAQCSVRDVTPATVAANSAIAVKISGTDDACTDAGDDFECLLYVTF